MGNIVYLPHLLPDEDYRSIVYRYYMMNPHKSYFSSRYELVGSQSNKLMLYPLNLERLVEKVGMSVDFIEKIICEHTFLPFYRSFLTSKQNQAYIHEMLNQSIRKPNILTSGGGKKFISNDARYCPACIEEEINQWGECYLHRLHQFLFLDVCPYHEIRLVSNCTICDVPLVNEKASSMLYNQFCSNGHNITTNRIKSPVDPFLRDFLDDLKVIMTFKEITMERLFHKIITNLGNRGYIHFKGNVIYKKRLLSDLIEFYGDNNLIRLGINTDMFTRRKFEDQFLNSKYARHNIPLYILLFRYLSGSASEFLSKEVLYYNSLPFGHGPWKCINQICPFYNKPEIKTIKRSCHEWIRGFFNCPHCGMKFSRKSDINKESGTKYTVETMGELFINLASQYYEEGFTVSEIAKKLYSNTNTVMKYLKLFYMTNRKKEEWKDVKADLSLGYREVAISANTREKEDKATILKTIKQLGDRAIRTRIKEQNQREYYWLMKHEPIWMEENLPSKNGNINKRDLVQLEDEIYPQVEIEIKKMWSNPPTFQITRNRFLNNLPSTLKSLLTNHPDEFTRIRTLLDNNKESKENYLVRRLPTVIQWISKTGMERCSFDRLIHQYAAYKNCSPSVRRWVENRLDKINSNRV